LDELGALKLLDIIDKDKAAAFRINEEIISVSVFGKGNILRLRMTRNRNDERRKWIHLERPQ
jgi:hypothetical protein